jgi:hypothetical protein
VPLLIQNIDVIALQKNLDFGKNVLNYFEKIQKGSYETISSYQRKRDGCDQEPAHKLIR